MFNKIGSYIKGYRVEEGLEKLVKTNKGRRKFLETLEISFNIKLKSIDLPYQDMINLPYPLGKTPKLAVLVDNDTEEAEREIYKSAGAQIIGDESLIQSIRDNKVEFDWLLTKPRTMPKLASVGKILGPRKLMPTTKTETLVEDLESSIKEFVSGKFSITADKNAIVNVPFGKISFSTEELKMNLLYLHEKIKKSCKNTNGNRHLKSVTLSSTMGKAIKINIAELP